jgi:histone H3/H4
MELISMVSKINKGLIKDILKGPGSDTGVVHVSANALDLVIDHLLDMTKKIANEASLDAKDDNRVTLLDKDIITAINQLNSIDNSIDDDSSY